MIGAMDYMTGLWAWTVLALAYALWRSIARPEPDAIRPAGPVEPR